MSIHSGNDKESKAPDTKDEKKEHVTILAIESSCDETAAAVVRDGREVLSNIISSQIALHTVFGGVVPEIASRKHVEKINYCVREALKEAGLGLSDIDAIGVTYGPGLVGALLVGVSEAKSLSFAADIPLVGVHHIEGHISANYIENKELEPPFACLVVSGGHSHLVIVRDYGEYEIIGQTRDDAAGEAFDKVARAIGLGYPGGPKIDKAAKEGNPDAISFPKANIEGAEYDFSFSGLKSAVLNYINIAQMQGEDYSKADLAASFQKAVVEVLTEHAVRAAREYGMKQLAIAGGVASNSSLRKSLEDACAREGIAFYSPSPVLCTDNAAMIGAAAYYEYQKGVRSGMDLNAVPNLPLGSRERKFHGRASMTGQTKD
ncbi:tRNA (adenosine(37)-N6)-threonylcarbamoyltransferase complex transferase subunit TsaD [Butyrivibrio sp. MC2013]|uniref:tRNA (adenosine(37)-N6)-threonylcarbamoyltransferase complex transferase subunit TsaD n=1 Tax=Butyrivibrio sp. MC2013 TaxID=1280686 RepID=UPI00068660C4